MQNNDQHILRAVTNILKDERNITNEGLNDLRDTITEATKGLDGREVLFGAARDILRANCGAITTAYDRVTDRKSVRVSGTLPDACKGLF